MENWVVKSSQGKVIGPFATDSVLRMIEEGRLQGEEMASRVPDGRWRPLISEAVFYDAVLGVLERNKVKQGFGDFEKSPLKKEIPKISIENLKNQELGLSKENQAISLGGSTKDRGVKGEPPLREETILEGNSHYFEVPPYPEPAMQNIQNLEKESGLGPFMQSPKGKALSANGGCGEVPSALGVQGDKNPPVSFLNRVCDFCFKKGNSSTNIESISLKEFIAQMPRTLLIIFGGVILFATLYLLWNQENVPKRALKVSLLAPLKNSSDLSSQSKLELFQTVLKRIEEDSFSGYVEAQNNLVKLIENSSEAERAQQLELRALLCTVHYLLWPYARQNTDDLRAMGTVAQSAKMLDVLSPYADLCEVIKTSVQGKHKETKSFMDSLFSKNLSGFRMLPVLYQIKGEVLSFDKDYNNAIGFLNTATEQWAKWLRPKVELAQVYIKSRKKENYGKATQILKDIVSKRSDHKTARYLLGIISFEEFRNSDEAFAHLSLGVESKDRSLPLLEGKALFIYSEILLSRSQKKEALQYAEMALELNPGDEALKKFIVKLGGNEVVSRDSRHLQSLHMGETFEKQGDCLAAQAEYKTAFEADSKNGTAALRAGKCLWVLNQGYEAVDWIRKAIKADPKLVGAYVVLSDYLSQRYDFLGATQILSQANRENPQNYEIMRGFALLEHRRGNLKGAIEYSRKSLALYDADLENLILLSKSSLELASSSLPLSKTDMDKRRNLMEDSYRFATKAIEIDGTSTEAQVNYAQTLSATQGFALGLRYLKEKSQIFHFDLDYKIAMAELLMKEERYTEAIPLFDEIINLDKRSKKSWLGLGTSLRAKGDEAAALRAFLEAAVIDPSDAEPLFLAGKLYFETQRFPEAIDQFKRVHNINPHFPKVYYYLGKSMLAFGNVNAALEWAKKEQQVNPHIADSYLLVGEIYQARGQFADCAQSYSSALKYRNHLADIYVKAAQCYRQTGSLEIADDMLSLALARESGYADIYKEQGALYEVKGDKLGALQSYKTYLGLSPNALDKDKIEIRMKELGGK